MYLLHWWVQQPMEAVIENPTTRSTPRPCGTHVWPAAHLDMPELDARTGTSAQPQLGIHSTHVYRQCKHTQTQHYSGYIAQGGEYSASLVEVGSLRLVMRTSYSMVELILPRPYTKRKHKQLLRSKHSHRNWVADTFWQRRLSVTHTQNPGHIVN